MIKVNVCLTDIPKECIREANGKKYLSLQVTERKAPDSYGNDYSVSISLKDATGNWNKKYCGSGKSVVFGSLPTQQGNNVPKISDNWFE